MYPGRQGLEVEGPLGLWLYRVLGSIRGLGFGGYMA